MFEASIGRILKRIIGVSNCRLPLTTYSVVQVTLFELKRDMNEVNLAFGEEARKWINAWSYCRGNLESRSLLSKKISPTSRNESSLKTLKQPGMCLFKSLTCTLLIVIYIYFLLTQPSLS